MKTNYILLSHKPTNEAEKCQIEQLSGSTPTQVVHTSTPSHIRQQVQECQYLLLLPFYRFHETAVFARFTAIELGKTIRRLQEPDLIALIEVIKTHLPHYQQVSSSRASAVADRKIASYILYHYTHMSLRQIAQIIPLSVATIGYYVREVNHSQHYDPELYRRLKEVIQQIEKTINTHESRD
ncbi:MAG: hypothetical protein ACK4EX_02365 [Thermaurantimonas sp.]|uniref:Chromosomal replication initiator DnaA C-terminal domain-containing protein n=1 Tax=Thermaurantimonas aggregans TaxID=2173829 RepID=A0A401XI31_9FLAO|nr:hypothetical protein [Thermaurantimonas aggregans]GCD76662.1 hypothetical protein JCM31826_01440 [Thermaurantimonas aggregans]